MERPNMFLINTDEIVIEEEFNLMPNTRINRNRQIIQIENHNINYELVDKVGLSIAESKIDPTVKVFYNSEDEDFVEDEVLRYQVYYQLTHPGFYDKELEDFLLSDKAGLVIAESIFKENADELLQLLKNEFDSKKSNIVPFRKKG